MNTRYQHSDFRETYQSSYFADQSVGLHIMISLPILGLPLLLMVLNRRQNNSPLYILNDLFLGWSLLSQISGFLVFIWITTFSFIY